MKFTFVRFAMGLIAAGAILGWSMPAFAGDDGDVLKQAEDLVKQAMNPGGDPPAANDRISLLKQALKLTSEEPDHRLRGKRVEAMRTIQLAIDSIQGGQEESKIYEDLDDADRELRDAIEMAEAH